MGFKYLTDIVSDEVIEEMTKGPGLSVFTGGTGTGKTYLFMNKFIDTKTKLGKRKSLVGTNRSALKLGLNKELAKQYEQNGICTLISGDVVATYQSLVNKPKDFFNQFHLIIADEIQYFLSDAWNRTTNKMLAKLIEMSKEKPVIFFTATSEETISYIESNGVIPRKYNYLYESNNFHRINIKIIDTDIVKLCSSIPVGEKTLIFNSKSIKKMKKVNEDLKEKGFSSDYIHSIWRDENGEQIRSRSINAAMKEKIDGLIDNKIFPTQFLVTNKTLDNGVDFESLDLKHIIIDNIYDIVAVIQMIGRKRFDILNPNDTVTIYLLISEDKRKVEKELKRYSTELLIYTDFQKLGYDKFYKKYENSKLYEKNSKGEYPIHSIMRVVENSEDVFAPDYKYITLPAYRAYCEIQHQTLNKVLNSKGDLIRGEWQPEIGQGFKLILDEYYNVDNNGNRLEKVKIEVIDKRKWVAKARDTEKTKSPEKKGEMKKLLDSYIDKEIWKNDSIYEQFRKEVTELLNPQSKKPLGINLINMELQGLGLKYEVKSEQSKKKETYNKTCWFVINSG